MKKAIFCVLAICVLAACTKNILDKEDKTGLGAETWDNESTATLYLNRCYAVIMPNWPANAGTSTLPYAIHNTNDESNTVGSTAILFGTLATDGVTDFGTVSGNGALAYVNIRKVNILLNEIDKGTLPESVRTKIKAEAYFLRAWNYFNLVKLYGGVPYLTKPQDWIEDNVYIPRNKTSECIDSIIRDLDMAALAERTNIAAQTSGNRGRITRGAAMAMKGRVLLYWASAQFNPNNDMARWEAAYQANKKAYDSLLIDGHALHASFANVLLDESAANRELIMIRSYDGVINSNSFENAARPSSEGGGGGYQPTWDLVQAFPMKSGLPITDPASGYDPVYYWKNRDPRFDATIVYNGAIWGLSTQPTRRQWTYAGTPNNPEATVSTTGFYTRKGVNTATARVNAANGTTDWVEIRLAEVMLNLAEAANATGRSTEAYDMLTKLRQRAGITAGTGNLYGLKSGMSNAEMFTAIMNERRIELAFEGKRYDDLRRTKLWTSLNGTFRRKLTLTVKSPHTTTTLNNFIPGSTTVRVRDTINVDGPSYTNFFTATITNIDAATSPINFKPEYYYYAIPSTHLGRNPQLLQTKGWATANFFEPLQ
ncbi:MAG: RagB/SusD family nutrient uptake outer membrane protein [Chitinophagaceae bacterium]